MGLEEGEKGWDTGTQEDPGHGVRWASFPEMLRRRRVSDFRICWDFGNLNIDKGISLSFRLVYPSLNMKLAYVSCTLSSRGLQVISSTIFDLTVPVLTLACHRKSGIFHVASWQCSKILNCGAFWIFQVRVLHWYRVEGSRFWLRWEERRGGWAARTRKVWVDRVGSRRGEKVTAWFVDMRLPHMNLTGAAGRDRLCLRNVEFLRLSNSMHWVIDDSI
jgi:hypothetical protein